MVLTRQIENILTASSYHCMSVNNSIAWTNQQILQKYIMKSKLQIIQIHVHILIKSLILQYDCHEGSNTFINYGQSIEMIEYIFVVQKYQYFTAKSLRNTILCGNV